MTHSDHHPAISWKAAIYAGLIAGLVFIVMEMVLVALVGGGSPLGPPAMISAIVLGPEVLPEQGTPPEFNMSVFLTGQIVHFVLSVILAVIFVLIVSRMTLGTGALIGIGVVYGIVVYLVNFYGMTAIYPWFATARNAITFSSHIVFGAVLGWSYGALRVGRA
ncbi:MAG: hypothetical protein CML61_00610 [Rhodobacteraceae bacterium]|nr:hypothetical protein [Paracoccaceae bacterium]